MGLNKHDVIQSMCRSGLLPVFRTSDARHLISATRAFYEAGISCVEYTMTMPNALPLLEEASARLPQDLHLGMGTVLNGRDADRAVAAGARFIASPGLNAEVVEACTRHGVVSVPGVLTPTEIMEALRLGADVLKIFPSAAVGPEFFSDVLGPFPGLHLMAASKTALQHLDEYVRAGAEIVTFLGNGLDAAAYEADDGAAITRAAKKWVERVQAARRAVASLI
jgi:2-dehydro-3-deoxyphosphogluconate aldolase/(4S)-4-hydroxy-2-oxoglutarate aldolase